MRSLDDGADVHGRADGRGQALLMDLHISAFGGGGSRHYIQRLDGLG